MIHTILIAQLETDSPSRPFWDMGSMGTQIIILIGSMLLMGFVFFAWAVLWRTPRKRKHSYHAPDEASLPKSSRKRSGLFGRHRHHRRHRRHHDDRPLNPTLSEVGGLPPERHGPPPGP